MSDQQIPTEKEIVRLRLRSKLRGKERERQAAEQLQKKAAASSPRRQARCARLVERKRDEEAAAQEELARNIAEDRAMSAMRRQQAQVDSQTMDQRNPSVSGRRERYRV